jgi:hypothetical protein
VESAEDRRIREMQEEAFRRKVDDRKRQQQARTSQTFSQVMQKQAEKGHHRRRVAQDAAARQSETRQKQAALTQRQLPAAPKHQETLRRAAVKHAVNQNLESLKKHSAQTKAETLVDRRNGFQSEERVERGHLQQSDHRDLERDHRHTEEKTAEVKEEMRRELADTIDGHRPHEPHTRDRSGGGDGDDRQEQAMAAAVSPAAKRPRPTPTLPAETLQEVVRAIWTASREDGRTHLLVELKGQGLEGAQLEVRKEAGAIHCTFHGCSAPMRQAIQSAKGRLNCQLAQRGLRLGRLHFG